MTGEEWLFFSPRLHALLAAWLSVIIGGTITILSFFSAQSAQSMSFFALCVMSVVDTSCSILVIAFWQGNKAETELTTSESKKEQRYTFMIGLMMVIMGIMLLVNSIKTILVHDKPYFKNPLGTLGLVISIFGVGSGLLLGWYKIFIARALSSSLVYADAISSLCAGLSSLVALIISQDHSLAWWADSAAGLAVACYTLYQGYITVAKSREKLIFLRLEERYSADKYDKFMQTLSDSYQQSPLVGSENNDVVSGEPSSAYYASYLTLPGQLIKAPISSVSRKAINLQRPGMQIAKEKISSVSYSSMPMGSRNSSVWSINEFISPILEYLSYSSSSTNNVRYFNNQEYITVDQVDLNQVDGEIDFHT